MVVKIVTSHAEFKTLTSGSTPVIVDFFATWCGPCKMISPKFKAFSEVYNNVIFIQIDVDDVSDVAEACEVRAMPTFQIYKDGKMIDEIVGADPVKLESAIKKFGMATHEEITHQALYQAQTNPTIKMLSQYKSFVQAGAYFPDWGYACLDNHQESELAHWPPFWEASINYIKSKYTKPYQQEANQLISFLFGVISHDVSDALWHSLNMNQGFIDVMKNLEFHGIYGKAHHEADIGGDLLISRFSKFEYLSNWEIPTTDLVTIYNSMGRNVTKKQIDICMSAGFGILMAEKSLGKYVLPNFAEKSPFLVESYFTYFRGGIESMSVAVVECWIKNLDELENGTINPSCNHMGTYYDTSQKREPPALLFIRDCISKIPSLVDVNSNSTSGSTTISESNLSRRYTKYCILANSITVPKINTLFQNGLVKTIGNLISAGIDYIRSDNCQLPTGTVLKTKTDYSMFGTSLATGDFDSDGKADLVFGSPGLSTDSNIQNGGIYLIKGGLEKNSGDTLIEDVAELFTGSFENGARFGSAMAVVDLNMDGIDDLAISAPLTGATDELQYGKVYVLFGRKVLGFRTDGLFDLIIDGKSTNSTGQLLVLGSILKAIDLDSDGFMDLLIGSPDSTLNSDTQQIGTVKAFYSSSKHSGLIAHSNADWTLFGSGEYNNFGKSITKIDQKLYIGATGYKSNELENSGAVFEYELSKGQSRFVKTHFGDSAFGAYGSNLGEHLQAVGSSFLMVSSIGETSELARARAMNLPGILVDESGYQGGVVRIYHDLNGKLTTLQGSGSLGHFGSAFASVGESGIIISEPFSYGERGNMYWVQSDKLKQGTFGIDTIYKKCWKGEFHEQFGKNILVVDVDGDGELDVIVSSVNDPQSKLVWSSGLLAGKVQIIWSAFVY